MRKSLLVPILLLFFVGVIYPAMAGNESCKAFNQCDPGGSGGESRLFKPQSTPTIGWLIAEGGTYFLKSSSNIDLLLSLVESSEITGTDFDALERAIDQAIFNIEQARAIYLQLKSTADVTPYDQIIISKLIEFDYLKFQQQKGLIKSIFDKVVILLCQGDVRGIYQEFHANTGILLDKMLTIKKEIDANVSPNLETLWRINQMFSEAKMYSQYVAEVFYSL